MKNVTSKVLTRVIQLVTRFLTPTMNSSENILIKFHLDPVEIVAYTVYKQNVNG